MNKFFKKLEGLNINPRLPIRLLLISAILVVYWQVRHHDFVNLDDTIYVTDNRQVKTGITPETLLRAFSLQNNQTYWHPLTSISHMLDVHLYGMAAGRHHLTNLFFHIANTLLLFGLLHRMTGHTWRSALVAALFALHPINVESVAWVAERKNVLSTFFWMLTLLIYGYYAKQPGLFRYLAVLGAFILGLLAKPMVVTLPFVLLVLDFWPLGRFAPDRPLRHQLKRALGLIAEKAPLLILSAFSIYQSTASVRGVEEVISYQAVPLSLRAANALVSYVRYMIKMIWPQNLAIFYPFPERLPLWQTIGASAVLIGISVWAFRSLKQRPYLAAGWLWYLGTLVPVAGWVQVGLWPALADRWAYVPLIGLFIMITWRLAEYLADERRTRAVVKLAVGGLLVALMVTARIQIGYWSNSIALFEHAIESTGGTWVEHTNLGNAYKDREMVDRAIYHYNLSLQKRAPEPERIYNNMGMAYASRGRIEDALTSYEKALRIDPGFVAAHINMGFSLNKEGRNDEANYHFEEAIRLNPGSQAAYFNFGNALFNQGDIDAAVGHYLKSLQLNPAFAESHNMLGLAFISKGQLEAAVEHFNRAVELKPQDTDFRRNLTMALSIRQELNRAVSEMHAAMDFNTDDPLLDLRLKNLSEKKEALDQVLGQLNRSLSLQPGFSLLDHDDIAVVAEIKRQYENTLPLFIEASRLWQGSAEAYYHIACIYARQGRVAESIKFLNQAIQKGFKRREVIETDSDLKNVRAHDDYQLLVKG